MPLREAFGLDLHTTKLVKDEIDNNADLPHKYFVSLAWSPAEVCRMWSELQDKMSAPKKVIEAALDDWKMNQAHKFVVELARDTNSHIQAYSVMHIHRPIPNQGKVYCPKKLRACRKGKCKHTGGNILQRTQ